MSLAEAAPSRPRSAAALQSRERQIDRAWREHEPERAMVPAEARRAVRAFKTTVASSDARFRSVFRSTAFRKLLQELLNAWCRRGALRAERLRAANRIKAALVPEAQFGEAATIDADAAEILLFWPSAHEGFFKIARPTFEQSGVIVAAARFVRAVGRGRVWIFPVLEIPDHALGRMYQRSPGIDAVAALNEAARAFLAADYRDVEA